MGMTSCELRRVILISGLGLTLVGCSWLGSVTPDKRPDYKTAKPVDTLEIPPDLNPTTLGDSLVVPTASGSTPASLSEYANGAPDAPAANQGGVLVTPQNMQLLTDGDQRWLVVQGDASQIWPRAKAFWLQHGFLLASEDPRIGIMETSWAENRADIPQDPIRRVLGKVLDPLYSSATRDKYRLRLERGENGTSTEIFLTHRGMEEVLRGGPTDTQTTVWKPRPSDPELEIEMLRRLMVHLGAETGQVAEATKTLPKAELKAQLVKADGKTTLTLFEDFSRAWRRTGVALDRTGFAVEDRNESEGLYYVRYIDPDVEANKGSWLSKIGFGSKEDENEQYQYQIKLTAAGANTGVSVHKADGVLDNSRTAQRILTLLHEQLQ